MTANAVPLWIDGRAYITMADRFGDICNPGVGEVIRRVPLCTAKEVDLAVQAAARAFPKWRDTTPLRRARVMMKYRELLEKYKKDLAKLAAEEHGKTLEDAIGSVTRGIEVVEFATGIPQLIKGEFSENVGTGVDCNSIRQPLGVCAGITPFNFPAMVPMWMYPMAIAAGNTFILKPSEKVPSTAIMLAELFRDAGLPDGVFNVVHGDKEVVDAILDHPQIKAVSFVGSTPVAKYIYETGTRNGKRVQALGGAKNHAVVLPDADLEYAADAIIGAAYGSAGERCMAISVVVAVGDAGDKIVDLVKQRAEQIKVGPGTQEGVGMGAVISAAHRDKVKSYIDSGVEQGARLVLDGRGIQVPGCPNGFYVGPTLFDHVRTDMKIYQEEIFGPVLAVVRANTLDEAMTIIGNCPYGNGTAIFTGSGHAARRFEQEIEVGMVGVNVPVPVPMSFFSFGGWKSSLFGDLHMHGMEGVFFYTRAKVVTTRWPDDGAAAPGLNMPTMN